MARQGWGRHSTVATGSDSGDQVSVNAWNSDINKAGMLGFTGETIASATSITPTATTLILSGSTNVSTIAITNTAEYDLLYIFTSGSVTLVNTSSPSTAGDIKLLANADTDLSTTVPTILIRKGDFWYEYGGSPVTNSSITFAKIQDLATMKVIGRTAASSGVSSEVAILDEDNMASDSAVSLATQQSIKAYVDAQSHSTVTASSTTTFTNKTIDQDGTGNSITNIADASIKASAGIDATKISDGSISNTEFKYLNNLSDNVQSQLDGKSLIAGSSSIVTVGILDTGSITSNFGNINIGSSTITTTGAVATGAITAGGTISGNLTGNVTGNTSGSSGSTTGNAATATALATARTIGGTSFDGTANIAVALSATSTALATARTIGGTSFDGTANIAVALAAEATTVTDNAITLAKMAAGTDGNLITYDTNGDPAYVVTGTATHVLTSNGAGAAPTFQAAAGGAASTLLDFKYQATSYTTPSYTARTVNDANTPIQLWVKDIDANNQGIYIRIKKNAAYEDVQIG
jgi:hypothetical protein